MFTYSRGSAITLAGVLLALVMKGRNAVILIVVLLIATAIAGPMIPYSWWARQGTILTYEEDGSAMSRIENWKFCWRLALINPLVGAGFQFQTREMFAKYAPEFLERFGKEFNTHNIFLAILTSHGFPALILFLTMIAFVLLSCRQMRRSVRQREDLKWIGLYCDIVQVSMLAFLMNGMFVNMEYFDLPYHLVALTASIKVIHRRLLAEGAVEIPTATPLAPAAVP
jgi:probable O-glycosylation ligase (exosortase A-associated)